jgi:hypothetical protein
MSLKGKIKQGLKEVMGDNLVNKIKKVMNEDL